MPINSNSELVDARHSLQGRSVTKLHDLSVFEINELLNIASVLKYKKENNSEEQYLIGKDIALIIDNKSVRTRSAFEIAVSDQGGRVKNLGNSSKIFNQTISAKESAVMLGKKYDAIEYQGDEQGIVEVLHRYAGVPIYNGSTKLFHPTHVLADFLTMQEHSGNLLHDISLCFIGDANNSIGNSLLLCSAKMGMDFRLCAPEALWPQETIIRNAYALATGSDAVLEITENVTEAVKACDFIYTDGWLHNLEQSHWESRFNMLKPYQVNQSLLRKTGKNSTKIMHSLPAFHNINSKHVQQFSKLFNRTEVQISDEIYRSEAAIISDQSLNRVHAIKSMLVLTL